MEGPLAFKQILYNLGNTGRLGSDCKIAGLRKRDCLIRAVPELSTYLIKLKQCISKKVTDSTRTRYECNNSQSTQQKAEK